jgi:hypothetical protein
LSTAHGATGEKWPIMSTKHTTASATSHGLSKAHTIAPIAASTSKKGPM